MRRGGREADACREASKSIFSVGVYFLNEIESYMGS